MERVTIVLEDGRVVKQKKENFLPYDSLSEEIKRKAYEVWHKEVGDSYAPTFRDILESVEGEIPTIKTKFGVEIDPDSMELESDRTEWEEESNRYTHAEAEITRINEEHFISLLPEDMRSAAKALLDGGYEIQNRFYLVVNDPHKFLSNPRFREVRDLLENEVAKAYGEAMRFVETYAEEETAYYSSEEYFAENCTEDHNLFNAETGEPWENNF